MPLHPYVIPSSTSLTHFPQTLPTKFTHTVYTVSLPTSNFTLSIHTALAKLQIVMFVSWPEPTTGTQ